VVSGRQLPSFQRSLLPPVFWVEEDAAADSSEKLIMYLLSCMEPDGVSRFFQNIGIDLLKYTASHCRRLHYSGLYKISRTRHDG
jgi:hypothetical protein